MAPRGGQREGDREYELIYVAALCGAARCGRVANKPQTITNDGQGETQIQTKAKQTLPAASAYEMAPKEQHEMTRERDRDKEAEGKGQPVVVEW